MTPAREIAERWKRLILLGNTADGSTAEKLTIARALIEAEEELERLRNEVRAEHEAHVFYKRLSSERWPAYLAAHPEEGPPVASQEGDRR